MKHLLSRGGFISKMVTLAICCAMSSVGLTQALGAKPGKHVTALNVVPTITSVTLNNAGQLVAAGDVTAVVRGQTVTAPFSNIPVTLELAADQSAAGECPILDLTLAPITLNLLGLVVETSPICLTITAYDGGGLLGDLLCAVAGLLGDGISLGDILGASLPPVQVDGLLAGIEDLLNEALGALEGALITNITHLTGRTCAILNLELGPVDLTLLGLNVHLDDCDEGPVTVDITAQRGQLLGNLLCGLLGGGGLTLGDTLAALVGGLLGL